MKPAYLSHMATAMRLWSEAYREMALAMTADGDEENREFYTGLSERYAVIASNYSTMTTPPRQGAAHE